jgi:hypothetical protein
MSRRSGRMSGAELFMLADQDWQNYSYKQIRYWQKS